MTYILPILLNLMRFAWLWPWMLLIQSFTSPSHPRPVVTPWLLAAVPLVSFLAATWITNRGATMASQRTATAEMPTGFDLYSRSAQRDDEGIGWGARLLIAVAGLVITVLVAWWHYYQGVYGVWNPRWLYELGYILTHWGTQEVPPEVLTVFFLIFLWINGMGDAVRAMTHDDVWGALVRSVVALVLFVALMTVAGRPLPDNLFYLVVLLFGSGMLALAFSSLKITVGLDRALGLGQRRIAAVPTISRYWLSSVLLTVFGLLAIGILIGILLAPEQLAALIDLAAAVLRWISGILGQILLFISYLLFMVVYLVMRLFEPLIQRLMERMADTPLTQMLNNMEQTEQMEQVAEGTAPLPDSYRWMGLAIVAVLVLIAFALAVRRLRTAPAAVEDETRESIFTVDLLQEQLGGLWNRWFNRKRSAHDPFLSLAGESEIRRRIRGIYQELLASAAAVGAARTPAETPHEYEDHLAGNWQAEKQALATITAAYHAARYAPDTPDATLVERVQEAWTVLERRLRPPAAEDDVGENAVDGDEAEDRVP